MSSDEDDMDSDDEDFDDTVCPVGLDSSLFARVCIVLNRVII